MESLPRALEAPPPRDPAKGKDLYANGSIALMGAAIATGVVLPAIVFGNLFRREERWDALDPSMIFAYAWTLVAAIVLVIVLSRWHRVRAIYRDGILTEASVETARFDPASPPNKRVTMELRYLASGREHRMRVVVVGLLDEQTISPGATVPILVHPRDPARLGVYARMSGLLIPLRREMCDGSRR